MDSAPPAIQIEAFPVMMFCVASATALTEEAHTLLTVVATVDGGRPAPRAHCRAGF